MNPNKIFVLSVQQIFKKSVPKAVAGENVGLLLRGVKAKLLKRGMWACKKGSIQMSNHYEGEFYLLATEEGGRERPLPVSLHFFFYDKKKTVTFKFQYFLQMNRFAQQMYSETWNMCTRFDFVLPEGTNMLMPGDHATAKLTLLDPMPMMEGQNFTVREKGSTIGVGKVTKVLPSLLVDRKKLNQAKVPGVRIVEQEKKPRTDKKPAATAN